MYFYHRREISTCTWHKNRCNACMIGEGDISLFSTVLRLSWSGVQFGVLPFRKEVNKLESILRREIFVRSLAKMPYRKEWRSVVLVILPKAKKFEGDNLGTNREWCKKHHGVYIITLWQRMFKLNIREHFLENCAIE